MGETPADDEEPATIADLVRRFRKRQRMSQAELAAAAGVSDGMIGNVERGTRNLGVETVEHVADALGLTDSERAELVRARKRFAGHHLSGNGTPDGTTVDVSTLSAEDRAAVRAIIESLKAKNNT